jgi:serine protease
MTLGFKARQALKRHRSGRKISRSHQSRLTVEVLESRRLLSASPLTPEPLRLEPVVQPAAAEAVAGELLVGFNAGANAQQISGIYHAHGLTELEQLYGSDHVRRVAVPEQASDAVTEALGKNPLVEYAEANYIASTQFTPDDPFYSYQWHLSNDTYGGIQIEQAWDVTSGHDAIVAVLDTGVAYENYSDSTGSYYVAPDLTETRFVPGYDFINNDSHANDDHSHGTHVAGTIAQSTDNARGVSGVAFNSSVMPVKVLGKDGSGSHSGIANGIKWSADNGANVINLSLGGSSPSQTLEDALAYAHNKGVTIVAAAGNDGQEGVSYPAAYDDYVIAVSATRYDEQIASYSNYGSSIDLAAPGGDTSVDQNGDGYPDGVLQNTFNPSTQNTSDFGYYFFQGTSMAAPHVSGVAALIVSQGVTDPLQVRDILESSAKDKGPEGVDIYYGHGIVDAAAALALLSDTNSAPVATDDTAETDEDNAVVIDVLSNDSDPDGDPLSVSSVTTASHGSVVINDDDSITYTPEANYIGSDSFTYTISDGNGGTDSAGVTVDVQAADSAHVHVGDLDASTHVKGKSGQWEVFVTAIIHDSVDQPVGGATVTGSWSGDATGTVSGTTNSDGTVSFETGNLKGGNSVTFSVEDVSSSSPYDPDSNHDPDGDSDGTTITVTKDGTTSAVFAASSTQSTSTADEDYRRKDLLLGLPESLEQPTERLPMGPLPASPLPPPVLDPVDHLYSESPTDSDDEAWETTVDGLLEALVADGRLL